MGKSWVVPRRGKSKSVAGDWNLVRVHVRTCRRRAHGQHYPLAEITMLSNSKTQKLHIDATAAEKGFKNVTVITGDVNVYDFEEKGK